MLFLGSVVASRVYARDGTPAVWLGSTLAFAWLTIAWRGAVPTAGRCLVATWSAILVLALAGHLVDGASFPAALRAALGVVVQASLMCLLYRSLRARLTRIPPLPHAASLPPLEAWRREWAPREIRDLLMLAFAATAATVLVLPIGVHPLIWAGEAPTTVLLRWTVQSVVTCFVGGACLLLIASAPRTWHRQPRAALLPLLIAASAGAVWLVLVVSDRPISWLLLLPSLYAGVVLPPWGTALHSLAMTCTAAALSALPRFDDSFDDPFPAEMTVLMLAGASTFVALALALLSQARREAVAELDARNRALAQQADLFQVVFDSMGDGLLLVDDRGGVTLSNAAAKALLGKPVPRSRLSDWSEYFGLRRLDGSPLRDAPGSPGNEDGDATVVVTTPGSTRVLTARARAVDTDDGNVSVVLFSDKTAEQERLSELTGFAGTVAHDLRAPLTGLEGWLELAKEALEDGDPEEAARMLSRTRLGASRMRQVVQDWLDYAVGRDGALAPRAVPVQDVAMEVASTFVGSGHDPEPRFVVDAPHVVEADPAMTRQVLANLVTNAVKYAVPGEPARIWVTTREDIEQGWVRIDVSDRGRGIPPGEEERIFEEFHRAPNHHGTVHGTGLGLALCRRIVTRHGGVISAHNNPAGGATITFTLPAHRVAARDGLAVRSR